MSFARLRDPRARGGRRLPAWRVLLPTANETAEDAAGGVAALLDTTAQAQFTGAQATLEIQRAPPAPLRGRGDTAAAAARSGGCQRVLPGARSRRPGGVGAGSGRISSRRPLLGQFVLRGARASPCSPAGDAGRWSPRPSPEPGASGWMRHARCRRAKPPCVDVCKRGSVRLTRLPEKQFARPEPAARARSAQPLP